MAYQALGPIAEQLGTSPEQTRRLLRRLREDLHEEAAAEGRAEVPGLGHFVLEDGLLRFEPLPPLANAVNRRFAGLSPIPVEPVETAEETSGASETEVDTSEEAVTPTAPDEMPAAGPEEEPPATEQEAAPWLRDLDDGDDDPLGVEPTFQEADFSVVEGEDAPADQPRPEPEPDEGSSTTDAPPPSEPVNEEVTRDEPVPAEKSGASSPFYWFPKGEDGPFGIFPHPPLIEEDFVGASVHPVDEPSEEASPASPPRRPASPQPARTSTQPSRALIWASAIAVVLLLAAGAWFLLERQGGADEPTAEGPADTQIAEDPPAETDELPAGPEAQEPDTPGDEPPADASETTEPSPPDPPGIDPVPGTWSMVVASETNPAAAEAIASDMREQLDDLPYAVDVLPSSVQGTTRYRVLIGQFASQSEGQAALSETADRLPEGSWLLQFEEDM